MTIDAEDQKLRAAWERMRLDDLGRLSDVVQGGGGKLSTTGGDPGEMRKQSPLGSS